MTPPFRILHVLKRLDPGGVETWLLHVLRRIDRTRFQFDFFVEQEGRYDAEVAALGGRIIRARAEHHSPLYARHLLRTLRGPPKYYAIHSHVHFYCGLTLALARLAGVPVRIAHSHNDTKEIDNKATKYRKTYLTLMRRSIERFASHGLATSDAAACALFGNAWRADPRWSLHFCAVDLTPFRARPDRSEVRRLLGVPLDAFVIGHVGRFVAQKNHEFIVPLARELIRDVPHALFLLIGDGPLRPDVMEQVRSAGLQHAFVFAGIRDDVPRLMRGAMDAFVFPSRHEGLGLVLLEAQAAGLPCAVADTVPHEAIVIEDLVRRLPLAAPYGEWARSLRRTATELPSQHEALQALLRSDFNVDNSVENLCSIYRSLGPTGAPSALAQRRPNTGR